MIFYGTEGVLVQREYTDCVAFDLKGNMIKEFKGGGDHFGNFLQAVRSRKAETLNSDAFQGHLSAALAHLANISYYLGEKNKVSVAQAKAVLEKVKSRDDNIATLESHRAALQGQRRRSGQDPDVDGPAAAVRPPEGGLHEQRRGEQDPPSAIPRPVRLPDGGQGVAAE